MDRDESVRQAAALRHLFQVNQRLDLEFRAALSKLFRDYVVTVSDELLGSIILAMPEELTGAQKFDGFSALNEADAPPSGEEGPTGGPPPKIGDAPTGGPNP